MYFVYIAQYIGILYNDIDRYIMCDVVAAVHDFLYIYIYKYILAYYNAALKLYILLYHHRKI